MSAIGPPACGDSVETASAEQIGLRRQTGIRLAVATIVAGIAVAAFVFGIQLRREEWIRTSPIRFESDVFNGFRWGRAANRPEVGLVRVYDLDARHLISGVRPIDYTPLRLTIVWLWAKWAAARYPGVTEWHNEFADVYGLTLPMLRLNMFCELVSSIFVFLLIRMWIIRMDDANRSPLSPPRSFRGITQGMMGATLFWFNPAVLWNAQCYPQWDVWNMPFFLGSVLLACVDCWFGAGFCLLFGAFLKGQVLLVAPLFLLWPAFLLQFGAVVRFICGFAFAAAMVALPWLLAPPVAILWYTLMLLGMAMLLPFVLRLKVHRGMLAMSLIVASILCWPWASHASIGVRLLPPMILAALALASFLPPKLLPHWFALAVAIVIFLMIPLYGASREWFTASFEYSTQKIMLMAVPGTFNLPAIFVECFKWANDPQFDVQLPLIASRIQFRVLMLIIYGICLTLSAFGAAVHNRRNDVRFLAAIVAPWLCFFVVLTQMNNRYLIWAAGFSSLLAGVSVGMTLLGIIVAILGWTALAAGMNTHLSRGTPEAIRFFNALTPHLGWALLMAAAIYLFVAIMPRRYRGTT